MLVHSWNFPSQRIERRDERHVHGATSPLNFIKDDPEVNMKGNQEREPKILPAKDTDIWPSRVR